MSEHALSRRSFLAGSAGAAALVGLSGYMSMGSWEQAHAEGKVDLGDVQTTYTLCNACSNKCGFTAHVVNGRLHKLIGDPQHPYAKGRLCGRGYGYSQIAYSKDRLTDPLKKNDKGQFEKISWDQAFQEIGESVKNIIASSGPESLAIVQDPRPSGAYYSKRFMNALGSANVYTHAAACNLSKNSATKLVIGTSSWISDVKNAKMTLFIGRSYADGIRPNSLVEMMEAHEAGSHIVIVDPRCNNSVKFADEWVPINPGTDLAMILAMSHIVVEQGLYDKEFVEANGAGFDEYVETLKPYTAAWAEQITGIPAFTIDKLAHEMAAAAPNCSIEQGWRGANGCQYKNSGECARAIALFNALMGCYNKKGGALFFNSVKAGKLDETKFPEPAKPEKKQVGAAEFPLADTSMGSSAYVMQAAKEGAIKGVFFYTSNLASGYVNNTYATEAIEGLDLSVCIDVQMSETAQACKYVLPDTSYLERDEVPTFMSEPVPCVTMRNQVLEKIHPNTKPCDEIFQGLAAACGVEQYFNFTVQELSEAQLATVGVDYQSARQNGIVFFNKNIFEYDQPIKWKTDSGKINFALDKFTEAGYTAAPSWVEPLRMPGEGEFRLIEGKQANHSHTMTANIENLMNITKKYDLTRAWMNADVAEEMGIKDGDEIEISNDNHTGTIRVKVTERINPTTIFLPGHFGASSKDLHTAYGVGLRPMDFSEFRLEPGYGSSMTLENIVKVKKVGA